MNDFQCCLHSECTLASALALALSTLVLSSLFPCEDGHKKNITNPIHKLYVQKKYIKKYNSVDVLGMKKSKGGLIL